MGETWEERLSSTAIDTVIDPGGPVLILSAHPDDEVLAVGAWLTSQRDRCLRFVTATDGEASHPGSPSITPAELRDRRPRELVTALRLLGICEPDVYRLRLPDGGLQSVRDELVGLLGPFVAEASLVLAPFEADGHPDHDVLGETAVRLCGSTTPLWRFPIWTWAWTAPAEQPWLPSLRRLPRTSAGQRCKVRAITAFATQVRPLSRHPADVAVVESSLMTHARRAPEVVLV